MIYLLPTMSVSVEYEVTLGIAQELAVRSKLLKNFARFYRFDFRENHKLNLMLTIDWIWSPSLGSPIRIC